ncbi:MAG: hypothetical protein EOR72_32545 [Mesorhizobium sp.]|uniref:hypothetical protein n=1 Tax=Mesorhizobium sp. TaxID=1871066 RepID=UPI000FE5F869|nr:hypothetical protein [Mesorhizobium sp.]RWM05819.1 MAG: hypothetical protein EOR72_32545 [Mesorhizobium sp.]
MTNNADEHAQNDLPDIVDVVMEMGRGAEDAKTLPSPRLPAPTSEKSRLPGHLEGLADRARDYGVGTRAVQNPALRQNGT